MFFFFFCINKALKSHGYWIPCMDLLRSTEYGADSSNCCHGVNGNEWCPVVQSEKPLSFTDVIRIGIAIKWDNLQIAGVSPATVGHYRAVRGKTTKTKVCKSRQSGGRAALCRYERSRQIKVVVLVSCFLVSLLAWIMKDVHLVYLSIQYLLLVRYIWGLFIIAALQAPDFLNSICPCC